MINIPREITKHRSGNTLWSISENIKEILEVKDMTLEMKSSVDELEDNIEDI